MPIVTLTTDFGLRDHSVAAIKGALYKELDQVRIVDISHEISPFNNIEASYVIKNAYQHFPKGSVHIIGVDSELTPENTHIAVFLDDHYFICADNGIISLIASEIKPDKMVKINIHNNIETNFAMMDVFIKVAGHILRGGTLEVIGKPIESLKTHKLIEPQVNDKKDKVIGHVIYVDNFGNLITNIKKSFFESHHKGRPFVIKARQIKFDTIYESYSGGIDFSLPKSKRGEEARKIALFNSSGYLELAIYKSNPRVYGGAASLYGLQPLDTITIDFL
jgi:S-adenosylmethionine hydrolase